MSALSKPEMSAFPSAWIGLEAHFGLGGDERARSASHWGPVRGCVREAFCRIRGVATGDKRPACPPSARAA